jgi:hypothetical protein
MLSIWSGPASASWRRNPGVPRLLTPGALVRPSTDMHCRTVDCQAKSSPRQGMRQVCGIRQSLLGGPESLSMMADHSSRSSPFFTAGQGVGVGAQNVGDERQKPPVEIHHTQKRLELLHN